jgi:hypothetical protein
VRSGGVADLKRSAEEPRDKMLEKYEKKEKKPLPRWLRNIRDIFLVVAALLGFAVVSVLYLSKLPQPYFTITSVLGVLAVGSFIRSLAK